jgi:AraC family transcriptional regulator
MREDTALQTLPSPVHVDADAGRASMTPSQLDRMVGLDFSASERIGRLVRRAMLFLESDREVAWRCLNDASTLLGPPPGVSSASNPITSGPFRPGGLARWQARRALAYIDANLESKLEVEVLAELVSFSKSHFSRAFKRSLGLPPMAYVMLRRIERAKVLMASTTQQLTEIALVCGFADQSHLNRSFRRLIGESPGRWRRTNAEVIASAPRPGSEIALRRPKVAAGPDPGGARAGPRAVYP